MAPAIATLPRKPLIEVKMPAVLMPVFHTP
jgi:hypothetical protein